MNELNEDITTALASFLATKELIALASTCRHFGGSPLTARRKEQYPWNEPRNHLRERLKRERENGVLSLIEKAAKREVKKARREDVVLKRGSLLKRSSRRESWFAPYGRLVQLRTKPVFYRIIGEHMTHHDNKDLSIVKDLNPRHRDWGELPLAVGQEVMSTGQHYAEFKAVRGGIVKIGIIRPGAQEWDGKIGRLNEHSGFIHYCVQQQSMGTQGYAGDVHHFLWKPDFTDVPEDTGPRDFGRRRGGLRDNDMIGIGVDLDRGELSVYFNNLYIGVKKTGLRGHYCWAVSILDDYMRPIIKISPPHWAKV